MKAFDHKKKISEDIWSIKDGKVTIKNSAKPTQLKKIVVPNGVQEIDTSSFESCENLESIIFPSSIKNFGKYCFSNCYNLSEIYIDNSNNNLYMVLPDYFNVILKSNGHFLLTNYYYATENNILNNVHEYSQHYIIRGSYLANYYIKYFDDKEKLSKLNVIKSPSLVKYFFKKYESTLKNYELIIEKMLSRNIRNYNLLIRQLGDSYKPEYEMEFIRLCDILGVFENKPIVTKRISKTGKEIVEKIDYAQKAREFIREKFSQTYNLYILFYFDKNMEGGFKKGFADFMFEHFDELFIRDKGFLQNCYHRFEEIQKAHTTNKGNCRQLAPTIDFFVKYLNENKFAGINKDTKVISEVIGKYYNDQNIFNRAVDVSKKNSMQKIPKNILPQDLKENIDENARKKFKVLYHKIADISEINLDNFKCLKELSKSRFTYEFLRKNDVLNLVLGKLCNCCAHLNGVGDGIAVSAMLDPDIQNLVIRDENDEIIAKATLYINREQGYGICNSFQVNNLASKSNIFSNDMIYQKLKQALFDFAHEYNKTYTPKLKIINVGMGMNDLAKQLEDYAVESENLLKPFNFKEYSIYGHDGYRGDAFFRQYTIWKEEDDHKM